MSYSWMGDDGVVQQNVSKITNIQFTPTRTIYVMTAGPMNLTVTFLSPIEVSFPSRPHTFVRGIGYDSRNSCMTQPTDFVKQSIPFSYLSVEASSLDGQSHAVQLYSDISAGENWRDRAQRTRLIIRLEWVSGNRSANVQWSTTPKNTGTSLFHQIELQSPTAFTEVSDQAQDSTVYYGIPISVSASGIQVLRAN